MGEAYFDHDGLRLYQGDAVEKLRELPASTVDLCVTSPPFWGLRDYGTGRWEGGDADCDHARPTTNMNTGFNERWGQGGGTLKQEKKSGGQYGGCPKCGAVRIDPQIGLEPSPEGWVEHLVSVFAEVHRLLKPTGVLIVECGDSYANAGSGGHGATGGRDKSTLAGPLPPSGTVPVHRPQVDGLKTKDLIGQPFMLAFALREAGWYWRGVYPWNKPNPMPESVDDRCTTSHSYVLHFAKSTRYFWDPVAIAEPTAGDPERRTGRVGRYQEKAMYGTGDGRSARTVLDEDPEPTRNARSVWTIPTEPSGLGLCPACNAFWTRNSPTEHCGVSVVQHYAAFPLELAEKAILAATPEHGCCPECLAPWRRVVVKGEKQLAANTWSATGAADQDVPAAESSSLKHVRTSVTAGWEPTCTCGGVPDLRVIESPTGEGAGDDPTMITGRKGMNRPRGDGEGVRPMTRYEQARYAEQLRAWPSEHRDGVKIQHRISDTAWEHYVRTDDAGARPLPHLLLEDLIAADLLERVEVPEVEPPAPVPAVVLDPFGGSGTTLVAARRLGRHGVATELNPHYCEMTARRLLIPDAVARAAETSTEPVQLILG